MNKFSFIAIALLVTSAMAQSQFQVDYEDFEIPADANSFNFGSATAIGKMAIGYNKNNDYYFKLVGFDHTQVVVITTVTVTTGKNTAAFEIPVIPTTTSQSPTGKNFNIAVKKYPFGLALADVNGQNGACTGAKFQMRFNSFTLKCTWTADPFTGTDIDETGAKAWQSQFAASKQWYVTDNFNAGTPVYVASAALDGQGKIGAATATTIASPKFLTVDTTTEARLLIDASANFGTSTTFQFSFKRDTNRKHFLVTLGAVSGGEHDTVHCYKEGKLWFVASTLMTTTADTAIPKYQVATVTNVQMDLSTVNVIIEFTKAFANTADATKSVTPDTGTNANRDVIIFAKDGIIKSDTEFIKVAHSLSLTTSGKEQQVGVSVPTTVAANIGSVEATDGTNTQKLRYQFYKGTATGTATDYDSLLVTVEVAEAYGDRAWIGFGIKNGNGVDVRVASVPTAETQVFTVFDDNNIASWPTDFTGSETTKNGQIVGSKVTSASLEVTFLITASNTADTTDASLTSVVGTSNTYYIFGKTATTANVATQGAGFLSQANKGSFTSMLVSEMTYSQLNTVDISSYNKFQQIGTADAKVGATAATLTFNGKFTYLTSTNTEASTAADNNKILFALTFKDTAADITGIVGLSFGKADGNDAHYLTVSTKAISDAKVTTAVTADANNAFTNGAYTDDTANANADNLVLKGAYTKTAGTDRSVFFLYERVTKKNANNADDIDFAVAATGTNSLSISDVFAFKTTAIGTLSGVITTPAAVDFKVNTQSTTLTAPSLKAANNVESVTLSYKIVKSASDTTALTKITELETDGIVEAYVNLLDGSTAFDATTIVAINTATNTYEGVQITNANGQISKVKVTTTGSGTSLAISAIAASTAANFDISNVVVDTTNKLVKFYVTKATFGYDSTAKELKQFSGIVITSEDINTRTAANTKGPTEFTHTASLSSAGLIAKATLLMIAVLFLYFN